MLPAGDAQARRGSTSASLPPTVRVHSAHRALAEILTIQCPSLQDREWLSRISDRGKKEVDRALDVPAVAVEHGLGRGRILRAWDREEGLGLGVAFKV